MKENKTLLKTIEKRIIEDCKNTIHLKLMIDMEFNRLYLLDDLKKGMFSDKFYRNVGIWNILVYEYIMLDACDEFEIGRQYIFLFFDIDMEIAFKHLIEW